jgi:hypothetical protein
MRPSSSTCRNDGLLWRSGHWRVLYCRTWITWRRRHWGRVSTRRFVRFGIAYRPFFGHGFFHRRALFGFTHGWLRRLGGPTRRWLSGNDFSFAFGLSRHGRLDARAGDGLRARGARRTSILVRFFAALHQLAGS